MAPVQADEMLGKMAHARAIRVVETRGDEALQPRALEGGIRLDKGKGRRSNHGAAMLGRAD
jgi:hypothetical protein